MSVLSEIFFFLLTPFGFVSLLVLYLIYFITRDRKDELRHIPGPTGFPVLGYLPFLGMKMHLCLTDLWKEFGDVYQITLGSRRVVVINGQKALRQALINKNDFGGRPDYCSYEAASKDALVGLNDFSPRYRIGKKILLKAFGNFVSERSDELRSVAHEAVIAMIEKIKSANNRPFDPQPFMYPIVCTIMGYVCWGQHFCADDYAVKHILENGKEFGRSLMFGVICDYFPWLKFVMRSRLRRLDELFAVQKEYTKTLARKHIDTYDGKNLRDITDFFHKVSEDMTEEEKQNLHIDNELLQYMGGSMFGAGFATIAITTKWAILLLGKHQEIQKKMQQELDSVVGSERYPTYDDSQHLPYTMSVIYEVYRYSSIAAIPFAHKTICDTQVNGLRIPKETIVICNLYSAHRDPALFSDADTFRPERFLNEDGTLNKATVEYVIPYGLGTRRCGGELVARFEVFTFIATLLQRCNIEEVPEHPLNVDDYKFTLALDPNPFQVIMTSRYSEW